MNMALPLLLLSCLLGPPPAAAGPAEIVPAAPGADGTPAARAAAPPALSAAGAPGAPAAQGPPNLEELVRSYRATGRAPVLQRATYALYPYGHERPVVRCAPLRACAIELQAAESVLATATGDSERWLLQTAASGPEGGTPLVVVKPVACDLTTNLVIATDRRVYEIELDSPPCAGADQAGGYNPRLAYTALLRFYYPEELLRRPTPAERGAPGEHGERQESERERGAGEGSAAGATAAGMSGGPTALALSARLAALNFNYSWRRDRGFPWTPAQVFDDGEHTYIVLPEAARASELPVLFAVAPDGSLALLNYHFEHGTYIADRVLRRAALVVGAGHRHDGQRLDITNRAQGS